MQIEEEWIKHFITRIKEVHGEEIKKYFRVDLQIPKIPFPRILLAEAIKIIKDEFGHNTQEDDLDSEGEKFIAKYVKKEFGSDFVFITDYPVSARPFYHMRKDDKKLTKSFDLIYNGVEITTGSQREYRYEILKSQAIEKKLSLQEIKDYLEFFKYGCPPHCGLGLSPSRVLMLLLKLTNVRETTFVPRDTQRLNP